MHRPSIYLVPPLTLRSSRWKNFHCPHISTAPLSKGWGLWRGVQAYLHCSHYLVPPDFPWVMRGMGVSYQYTWCIGCCATWCNIPVPLSSHLLVVFKPQHSDMYMGNFSSSQMARRSIIRLPQTLFLSSEMLGSVGGTNT